MRKVAIIGIGILAGVAMATFAFAQTDGVRAQAFAARRDAELLRIERFVGTYQVEGSWEGKPVTGTVRVRKAKEGGYEVAFALRSDGKSIESTLALRAGGGPSELVAAWDAGKGARKGTLSVDGREIKAKIATPGGETNLAVRIVSRDELTLRASGGGLPPFDLRGKRR